MSGPMGPTEERRMVEKNLASLHRGKKVEVKHMPAKKTVTTKTAS